MEKMFEEIHELFCWMGRSQPEDSKKAKKWGGNFTTNKAITLVLLMATALPM